jgi:hypothetical protein
MATFREFIDYQLEETLKYYLDSNNIKYDENNIYDVAYDKSYDYYIKCNQLRNAEILNIEEIAINFLQIFFLLVKKNIEFYFNA